MKLSVLLVAALLIPAAASADTTWVTIGSPVRENAVPFWGQTYDAFRCQWLYFQSEINQSGNIVAIGLYSSATSPAEYYHVTVSCCNTPVSELTQNFIANYGGNSPQKLLDAETLLVGTGVSQTWYYFPGSFVYNNTDNLIVEITWRGDAGVSVPFYRNDLGHINRRCFGYSDTASNGFRDTVNGNYIRLGFLPTGVEGRSTLHASCTTPSATIVRGILLLPRDMTELPDNSDRVPRPALLDASGRRVMDLMPGQNDIRHVAPGVYFVKEGGIEGASEKVSKLVITR